MATAGTASTAVVARVRPTHGHQLAHMDLTRLIFKKY